MSNAVPSPFTEKTEDNKNEKGGAVHGDERRRNWEAEQATKPLIEKGVTGKVKWYSVRYHYGFIARDDDRANDVFVHQTAIAKSRFIKYYLRTLGDGEEVVFDIVEGKQGPEAANVTGPDGAPVRGSRFAVLYRRRMALNRSRRWRDGPFDNPSRWEGRGGRRRISTRERDDVKETREEQSAEECKENEVGNGRRRRVRNFRARRQQPSMKKGNEEEEKEAAGDFKNGHMKENDVSNVPEEGFGDGRRNRRLGGRRGERRRMGTEGEQNNSEVGSSLAGGKGKKERLASEKVNRAVGKVQPHDEDTKQRTGTEKAKGAAKGDR